ncbi:MAG: TrkA C-terminal domain-containing protein, partial [bacterium]
GDVIAAKSLGFSDSRLLQVRLSANYRWLGRPLSDIGFPRTALVAALLKSDRVVTPRGDTVLEAGDEVIVFALPAGVAQVENFFAVE